MCARSDARWMERISGRCKLAPDVGVGAAKGQVTLLPCRNECGAPKATGASAVFQTGAALGAAFSRTADGVCGNGASPVYRKPGPRLRGSSGNPPRGLSCPCQTHSARSSRERLLVEKMASSLRSGWRCQRLLCAQVRFGTTQRRREAGIVPEGNGLTPARFAALRRSASAVASGNSSRNASSR